MKVHLKFAGQVIQPVAECASQYFPAYAVLDGRVEKGTSALLVIGSGAPDEGYALAEFIDPSGMSEEELLFHVCAKLGKLSRSDAALMSSGTVFSSPRLSRRELIAGIRSGFRAIFDYPLIFDEACEAGYGCRRCIDSCPEKALSFDGKLALDREKCTMCGLCVGVCPVGAIQAPRLSEDAFMGMLEGMKLVNLKDKALMLTDEEVSAPPRVHVERVQSLEVVSQRWIAMALASGVSLVLKGKISERLRMAAHAIAGQAVREGEDYVEMQSGVSEAIGLSGDDSWFNYVSSIRALKGEGSRADGLGILEVEVSDTCTLCGACASKCPHSAFSVDQEGGRLMFNPSLCTGCGLCVSVCPEGSIKLREQATLSLKPRTAYQDEVIRCARCGKPIYTRKFYSKLVKQLGREDPMLRYCNECKQRIIYERIFGKGGRE